MDFTLNEEQEAFRETARRFARDRLAPDYQKRDVDGDFDRDLLREMGGLGLIAPDVAEEFGGIGSDGVSTGVVVEELSVGDINFTYVQILGSLAGQILSRHAPREVAEHWLPKIVGGEALSCLGLTEPRGGSDAANAQVRAEKSGNGYVLNGEKASISMADKADVCIVFARTGTAEEGAHGVSAFVVPMDEAGISTTRYDDIGARAVGRGSIHFDDVRIPADHLLDDEGKGFVRVMQGFDYSRALIGLQCVAAARASLDETWAYTTERLAFGAPIAQYQGVTFPLAEAETAILGARLMCYHTLALRDRGEPHTAEAAMCKWYAPKSAVDAIHQCLLTHGHFGYTTDTAHQQRLRDVMGLEIGDGTAQIMKLIIAREKVGRVAVQYAPGATP